MKEVTTLLELIETNYYEDLVMMLHKGDRKGYTWNPASSQIDFMVLICLAITVNGSCILIKAREKGVSVLWTYSFIYPG